MPYATKAKSQQFTRRKLNLVKKADQLARLCHADLALIIRKNGRYYMYRSTDHDQWPPTMSDIVCIGLDRYIHLALTRPQKESYPLPVNLLPRDFDNRNRESPQRSEEPSTITLEVAGLESLQDP